MLDPLLELRHTGVVKFPPSVQGAEAAVAAATNDGQTRSAVVRLLLESGSITAGQIGERLGLESSTLTPLLKRLEAAGLVTRRRGGDNQRIEERAHVAVEALRVCYPLRVRGPRELPDLEGLRKILAEIVRRASLQRFAVAHHGFDRKRLIGARESFRI